MAADQVLKRFARQIRKEDASRRAKAKAHLTGNMAQTRRLCLISRIHQLNCSSTGQLNTDLAKIPSSFCLFPHRQSQQNAKKDVQNRNYTIQKY